MSQLDFSFKKNAKHSKESLKDLVGICNEGVAIGHLPLYDLECTVAFTEIDNN